MENTEEMVPLTVRYGVRRKFSAAHSLPGYDGRCSNVHGHTWVIDMSAIVRGIPNQSGIIVDFNVFKKVVDQFDHEYLNDLLELPSAEILADFIARKIAASIEAPVLKVLDVTVWESEDCSVTVSWPFMSGDTSAAN